MTKETPKAASAFAAYCELGETRSLKKLGESWGKVGGYEHQLQKWSSKYNWVARAAQYDAERRERESVLAEQLEEQEIKRKAAREARRAAARERMEDSRAEVFGREWVVLMEAVRNKVNSGDTRGLVGLASVLKLALDEEKSALGAPTQSIEIAGKKGGPIELADVTAIATETDHKIARIIARGITSGIPKRVDDSSES